MAITDDDLTFLIRKRLAADSDISSLAGTRIRPDALEQNETLPAIRYELLSFESWGDLVNRGYEGQSRIQIDCYGATRLTANRLAAAVKDSLDGFTGTLGNITIFDSVLDNQYDRRDPPTAGSKHWRRRRTSDYVITHTTPQPTLA